MDYYMYVYCTLLCAVSGRGLSYSSTAVSIVLYVLCCCCCVAHIQYTVKDCAPAAVLLPLCCFCRCCCCRCCCCCCCCCGETRPFIYLLREVFIFKRQNQARMCRHMTRDSHKINTLSYTTTARVVPCTVSRNSAL